jgi:hypothetical protein
MIWFWPTRNLSRVTLPTAFALSDGTYYWCMRAVMPRATWAQERGVSFVIDKVEKACGM